MEEYLDTIYKDIKLDSNQKEAVVCDAQNEMIIAGAGSGKTTTMAAKVKYLVEKCHVSPKDIIVISFTNKATDELKERINNEFKINTDILTFHKLGLKILGHTNKKIIDETATYKIISTYLNKIDKRRILFYFHNYFTVPSLITYTGLINKYAKICKVDYHQFINILFSNTSHVKMNAKGQELIRIKDDVIDYYNKYKKDNNLIDFNDMITEATKKAHKVHYEYVIVDEYQDISEERYELLEALTLNSHLIVVGDDWQAIYAFAGSDVNIFRSFLNRPNTKSIKIVNTYRNSQELIDIAGGFIMQDAIHIKKELISHKHIDKPVKIIYVDEYTKIIVLNKLLATFKSNEKILMLGRFTFDINEYLNNKDFILDGDKVISKKHPDLDITFLTVHAAKGLGFDQVIVINMQDGIHGFPSTKKNPEILNLPTDQLEERRLFYVALTRTKNNVYLLTNYVHISPYIKEIENSKGVEVFTDYK